MNFVTMAKLLNYILGHIHIFQLKNFISGVIYPPNNIFTPYLYMMDSISIEHILGTTIVVWTSVIK